MAVQVNPKNNSQLLFSVPFSKAPKEIWEVIFKLIKKDHSAAKEAAFSISRVCKDFRLLSHTVFPEFFLPGLFKSPFMNGKQNFYQLAGRFNPKLSSSKFVTSNSENKISIFKSGIIDEILYFFVQHDKTASSIHEIKLKEALKGKVEEAYLNSEDGLEIVNCHFIGTKLTIVCKRLVIFMKWSMDGITEFDHAFFPFQEDNSSAKKSTSFIQRSTCLNGNLYLQYTKKQNSIEHGIWCMDFLETSEKVTKLNVDALQGGQNSADLEIKNINGNLYHLSSINYSIRKIELNSNKFEILDEYETDESYFPYKVVFDKWIIVPGENSLNILEIETKKRFEISVPKGFVEYFVQSDFLIIKTASDLSLISFIYLPTQVNLTKLLAPHIPSNSILVQVNCHMSQEEMVVTFFLQNWTGEIKETQITLDLNPMQKSNPVRLNKNPQNHTQNKIAFIAAGIFLLLTVSISVVLFVLKPGTILYQGKGLLLTMPNVAALAAGGSMSLLLLALGSYRWWKQQALKKGR